jgi:pimeloyl-ACP methyl ester carboxylesterase
MKLAFQSYGSSGPALIVLHGLFGSRDNWHSICRILEGQFRVFATDQRNHGDSPHDSRMDYPVMAEDLLEFVDDRGLQQVHVLGHSMGAKTAMQFALHHPTRVKSLISVDMAPRQYPPYHENILKGLRSLNLESFRGRQEMEQTLEPWVPDLATRRFLLKNARRSPGGFRWRFGLEEIAANYAQLCAAVDGPPHPGPALFIRGQDSDYVVDEDLPLISRLFPEGRLSTISGAGHLVHAENPDALLRQVVEFLTQTA